MMYVEQQLSLFFSHRYVYLALLFLLLPQSDLKVDQMQGIIRQRASTRFCWIDLQERLRALTPSKLCQTPGSKLRRCTDSYEDRMLIYAEPETFTLSIVHICNYPRSEKLPIIIDRYMYLLCTRKMQNQAAALYHRSK